MDSPQPDEKEIDYIKRIKRFAVDGVLHYGAKLSKEFNVICIAVTGQRQAELQVSHYLFAKGDSTPTRLITKADKPITQLIPWSDYIEHATFNRRIQRLRLEELMAFSRELHVFMRDHAKLKESQKPLIVSGTLIALKNPAFALSFGEHTPGELQGEWLRVIKMEIEKADIPQAKKENMAQPYSGIAVHPELGKPTKEYPKGVLHELISRLNRKVWPFISIYHDFDIVGQFYGEFLKYTGGDKKALGIVLTPRHITELFARLVNVDHKSKVLDICAGTGGFLISAMKMMLKSATTEAQRKRVLKHGLIGAEQQPDMFALAASNMILRGDGKANLHQGSCFDTAIAKHLKTLKCDIGMLNPPFSQGDSDRHELYFVAHMLRLLAKGGTGIAILPMSCAISPHPARTELLAHHTLEAVMSMPPDLFSPVGVVTCVMIFTANIPHSTTNKKTWFGYWRDDGFSKTKHLGRIDLNHRWEEISDHWVESYRNRQVESGFSVMRKVTDRDEWCAEAYMQTDYSSLSQKAFELELRHYLAFELLHAPL